MNRRQLPLLILVLLALGGALLAAACFRGGNDDVAPTRTPEVAPTSTGDITAERLLRSRLASNRTEFSVCVDGAGGVSVTRTEIDKVRQAVDSAIGSLSVVPTAVTEGCPPPLALTGEKLHFRQLSGSNFSPRYFIPPELPSLHRIFVYFVSPEAYAASFDQPYPYVFSNEEVVCELDICNSVSSGLYVTSDITSELLGYAIQDFYRLKPDWLDTCNATPELSWCAKFWRESNLTPVPPD